MEAKDVDIRLLLDECIFLPYNIQEYGIIRLIVDDYLEYGLSEFMRPHETKNQEKMNRGLGYLHSTVMFSDQGLYGACLGGYIELAELMISKGADNWNSALYDACRGGHMELAELMISKGANHWDWGLWGACEGGHLALAELMIFKGATQFDEGFRSAYCNATVPPCMWGSLKDLGADTPNSLARASVKSRTYKESHLEIMKLLISKGGISKYNNAVFKIITE